MQKSFIPFDETKDPRHNTWLGEDNTDKAIPKIRGFVTDLVYATRGREIASLYGVWSALFLLSSVLQRDAWFTPPGGDPWLDKELLNLYLIFIGPAGCGKSSAVNVVNKVLAGVMAELKESDNGAMRRKEAVLISNMATPEAFLGAMYQHTRGEEGQRRVLMSNDANGNPVPIKAVANGIASISEFGSLLGKQNYQQGMATTLLDLYDCPEVYRWNTVKRGAIHIPEVFFNMLGATTADSISSNVNASVIEDGFMSRTVMAHIPNFPRKRDFRFQTQCSMSELSKRLTWIANTQVGNYQLDPAAREYYSNWYETFMKKMNDHPEKAGYMIRNRSLALKVAVLLKISDYNPGKTVHIEHLKAAFDLIKYTYIEVADLINYFANARVGAAKRAIVTFLSQRRSGGTRRALANKLTRYNAETVDAALIELYLEGKIIVVNDKGDSKYGKRPEGYPQERYAIQKVKHKDDDFELDGHDEEPVEEYEEQREEEPVLEDDTIDVFGWGASDDDSEEDAEEPVGDISSTERVWG